MLLLLDYRVNTLEVSNFLRDPLEVFRALWGPELYWQEKRQMN